LRLTTSALSAAVLGTALAATPLLAQQNPLDSGQGTSTASIPGLTASRGARYLLRNGWDYLKYQEYERALNFFVEAERRKAELNDSERQALVQGIDKARRGMREASDGSSGRRAYAGRGPISRPGSFALARTSAKTAAPAPAPEPIQLTSGTRAVAQQTSAPVAANPAELAALERASTPEVALPPLPVETMAKAPAAPAPGDAATVPAQASTSDLPPLELNEVPLPSLSNTSAAPAPAAEPAPAPTPTPAPAPATEPTPAPAPATELTPAPAPVPVSEPAPVPDAAAPAPLDAPESRLAPAPLPAPETPAPVSEPAAPAVAPEAAPAMPEALPEPPRVAARPEAVEPPPSVPTPVVSDEPLPAPAESIPPRGEMEAPRTSDSFGAIPERAPVGDSTLSPELQREVERIAQKQEDDLRSRGPDRSLPGGMTGEVGALGGAPGMPSPRLEISRAPSPTEARPIRAIPVPDEFVPLPKRDWEPQRKYWSSAAVCHMPLYFQDAALERYGQSVEQAVGPTGRYFSYPVDDPKQSIQRNQIAQPFASIGLFAAQIALLPYNLIMDPPWEAEYDLGYYRPGDRIPTDTYYLPLTGVGPPLHGKRY